MPPANLQDLVKHFPHYFGSVQAGLQIDGLATDSRQVSPGEIFFALVGGNTDGHQYIPDAIQRGAAAVVGTQELSDLEVPYLKVNDGRLALAQISAAFYNFPAQELVVIGVTGTDGKTTTANLVYSILQAAGIQTGMITTVNAQIGEKVLDTGFHVTTPEAPDVQRYLAEMVSAGIPHVVLEATSHGLAQERVAECGFDLAVVTNITHEHLDYHGSYEEYRSAKSRLFTYLADTPPKNIGNPRLAVLNKDEIVLSDLVAKQKGITIPILDDSHNIVGPYYSLTGLPETFIINNEGILVEKFIGPAQWDAPKYIQIIMKYINQ